MAVLDTGDLTIPTQILEPWLGKVSNGSAVATLSGSIPMKFGAGTSMTFDIGEAEYVGEGANKGASTVTPTTKTVTPFKFHKTVRFTEEVLWADEDHQLGVVSDILDLIQPSLSRALDFGVFHAINPTGGAAVAAMTESLSDTTNSVELGAGWATAPRRTPITGCSSGDRSGSGVRGSAWRGCLLRTAPASSWMSTT